MHLALHRRRQRRLGLSAGGVVEPSGPRQELRLHARIADRVRDLLAARRRRRAIAVAQRQPQQRQQRRHVARVDLDRRRVALPRRRQVADGALVQPAALGLQRRAIGRRRRQLDLALERRELIVERAGANRRLAIGARDVQRRPSREGGANRLERGAGIVERIGAQRGHVVQRLRRVAVVDERGQERFEKLRRHARARQLGLAGLHAVEGQDAVGIDLGRLFGSLLVGAACAAARSAPCSIGPFRSSGSFLLYRVGPPLGKLPPCSSSSSTSSASAA